MKGSEKSLNSREFLACKTVWTRSCILVPEGGSGQLVINSQLNVYILLDKWLLKWSGRTWFQVWWGTRKPRKTTNNMFLRLVSFVTCFGLCFKPVLEHYRSKIHWMLPVHTQTVHIFLGMCTWMYCDCPVMDSS